MSVALESLKSEFNRDQAKAKAAAWRKYLGLLRTLVDGGERPTNKAIAAILESVDRSIDNLAADCDNLKYRDQIRSRLRLADEARAKHQAAKDELERLKEEKRIYLERIVKDIESAAIVVDSLSRTINAADEVPKLLRESCRNPGLFEELAFIDDEVRSLNQRLSDLRFVDQRHGSADHQQMADIQNEIAQLDARRREIYLDMERE